MSYFELTNLINLFTSRLLFLTKTILSCVSVVVVCANPLTVREILLAADELNMVDSGEYVFFNIELFNRLVSINIFNLILFFVNLGSSFYEILNK